MSLRVAILPGFSRYEILETGVVRYRDTGKICPNYDDGKNGYRKIKIYPDGCSKRKSFWVNRLVWEAFWGPIPYKHEIDHLDANRLNNSLDNLLVVTHKQNQILKKQRDSRYLFNREAPARRRKVQ